MGVIGVVGHNELFTSTLGVLDVNTPTFDALDDILTDFDKVLTVVCLE